MTAPIDIPALKAVALAGSDPDTGYVGILQGVHWNMLALIERLERAEAVAEYARSLEMPTTEKQVKAVEMFFTAPMMARLEKLEAVATAAREAADYHKLNLYSDGAAHALLLALAALEAAP